jgi:two-component system sensor kinase FixL
MIGLAAMSFSLLLLLGEGELSRQPTRLAASLPVTIMLVSQAGGLLLWLIEHQRGLPWSRGRGMRPVNIVLVAVLVLPAILLPLQLKIVQAGLMPQLAAEILASACNVLIVVCLLGWTVERLSREQRALAQTTAELHASEARVLLAIEAHGLALFEHDVATGRLQWTPGSEQRLGLESGSLSRLEQWEKLIDAEDRAAIQQMLADAVGRHSQHFCFQYRLHRGDGSTATIEGSWRCFYDKRGRLTRTISVNHDVTEREQREAALRIGQAQLQSILETVPDAMVVIDEAGRIESFSTAAERLFGYRAKDVVGRDVGLLMPAGHAERHQDYLAHYRRTGERRMIGQTRILCARRADGTEIPIELSVGEAWVEGKRIFTGFIRDISDRVVAEERMEQLNAEYAHSARLNAMGEMAAALAHELNQPLAAIGNFLGAAEQMILRSGGNQPVVETLENANAQVLRTGQIIRRLRDFMAKRDVELHVEDLAQVVHDAAALALVGQLHVAASYEIAPDAQMIIADRIQVQQVLVNVLRNAAEAVRDLPDERRAVSLSAHTIEGGLVEVTVADQGPGFPRKVLANLHAPFLSTKAGMGVGLAISRRIIEAHGGTLSARNGPGSGAIVSFTLPLYEGSRQEAE